MIIESLTKGVYIYFYNIIISIITKIRNTKGLLILSFLIKIVYDVRFAQVIIVIVLSIEPIIPAIKAPIIEASKN